MKHQSVLLPTQFRRAWWSYAKLSNTCLFASISSRKPEGFASRGHCANSTLNPQGPPSPSSAGGTSCSPACQACFSFPNQRWSVPGDTKWGLRDCGSARQEVDSQFPAPARQNPVPVGIARPPKKSPCKASFYPPRLDLKLILCVVPPPHINPTAAARQCGVWTEATLPCHCLPNVCWRYCVLCCGLSQWPQLQ